MLGLLASIVSVFGGYLYLASPSRVAKLAGDLLTAITAADVRIESAHFGLDGIVTLKQVQIRIRKLEGDAALLFDAERVLIKHNMLSLITGVFRPRTLRLINPTLHLTEIAETGQFNFQHLLAQRPVGPSIAMQLPGQLPQIIIRNGRVSRGVINQGQYSPMGEIYLGGNLNPSPDEPGTYFFQLRQERPREDSSKFDLMLSGRIDLEKLRIESKMEHFALDSTLRIMLPKQLQTWWDQLEPIGNLPSLRFGYDPDPAIGLNAELELSGVSITLPYGELDSRMTDVSGRFTIANQTITVTDMKGQIEDLQYVINGQVHGLSRDAPFRLSVQTGPFAIPEEPRYLLALPTAVQKRFRRFSPSGWFQAQAVIQRVEPAGRMIYEGSVRISKAKLAYHQFPYPLEDVHGELRFNDEQIELVNLKGRGPTGANVTITGIIAPPKDGAAVHVVVTAVNSPVDHVLYDAMPEKYQPILNMFFNQKAHQRLLDLGLIQTRDQQSKWLAQLDDLRDQRAQTADVSTLANLDSQITRLRSHVERPVFELGGRATVIAQCSRAYGPNRKFRTTVGLDVSGVNALYEYWPYPVRCVAGKLLIKPDQVVVDNIELEGIGGATGNISGHIAMNENPSDQRLTPELNLSISHMPSDEMFFASIASPNDLWLRHLRLQGSLDVAGKIFRNEQSDQIDYRFEIELSDGHIQPDGGRFTVEKIAGKATLEWNVIEFDQLEGQTDTGQIKLSGIADWSQSQTQLDLKISATTLQLDQSLLNLLYPGDPVLIHLTEFFETYRPTGQFDAQLSYQQGMRQEPDYKLDLQFDQLQFWIEQQKIEMSKIHGKLVATPEAIVLDHWGGSFGEGGFVLSGSVGAGSQNYWDLTFDAHSQSICPTTRSMLPEAVLQVIDGLELSGGYEMHDAHLVYRPIETQSIYNFHGKSQLHDATATVGVSISKMDGLLEIHSTRRIDSDWPRMDLKLDCPYLLAAGRVTSPLSLHISSDEKPDQLIIRDLRGSCYGGTLLGSGKIELGEKGRYQMNLVLQNVALNPFLYPLEPPNSTTDAQESSSNATNHSFTGVLAASLTIEGYLQDSTQRRGRGKLEIRDANLYEVPLSLALIQILNLSLPSSRSFDRASASYLIEDDLVLFDSIRFEAPTIEIIGTGLMRYSTLELDLDLYTRNPDSQKFGLLADLLSVFKDELLSIHVTGTMEDPKPNATSFQGFRRSWQELFGGNASRTHRLLPLSRGSAN